MLSAEFADSTALVSSIAVDCGASVLDAAADVSSSAGDAT